ncbi:MAG: glycoside hydrolase family 95 protein [Treponema sp.]|nr:glycoside hydrolase family 95 protein [Treponema sp.]
MNNILSFNVPPATWEHFLPLGNGRMGAMVKAHPCNEVIQLNEEGIWSGGPQDRTNPSTKKALKNIRNLVKTGHVMEAQELAFRAMSGTSFNTRVYQTAGDFHIDFYESKNYGIEPGFPLQHKVEPVYLETYSSQLDLSAATTTVTYKDSDNVKYTRTTWISTKPDMLFMYVTASEKKKINFRGYFDRGIWSDSIYSKDGFIFMEDSHGIPFCAGCGVITDSGFIKGDSVTGACIEGTECNSALFFIDIKTWQREDKAYNKKLYDKSIQKNTWSGECYKELNEIKKYISKIGIQDAASLLLASHVKEFQSYYNRMTLQLGAPKETENVTATPELLKQADKGNVELINTYANFSRYLLISGSRTPGKLPLTLQGLWNCYMDPPWGSKYTININAQMNYWPVNMCNLSDCELPLIGLLERVYLTGCNTAKKMYGCRGYVAHHNTDFWGDSAPQDAWLPGTYWVLGAAWLATHIYEHYEYTLDKSFLKKYYYLMHEACQFFVDFLQPGQSKAEDGKPYLVINPTVSPENSYVTKAGQTGCFSQGCQMDNMILYHLFVSCLKANKYLKEEALDKKGKLYNKKDILDFEYVRDHLQKPQLNPDGSLMEWNEVVEEVEKGHRHISHLYGLFPGISIYPDDEILAGACKKTLENRLSNGGGHTGWSQSWIINFYASLGMKKEALEAIVKLLSHSTLPNLLDNHPPFQIDGNFGTLSGIMRLLVQSRIEDTDMVEVKLLPVLPEHKNWKEGSLKGACVKGAMTVDFEWNEGKVTAFSFYKNGNLVKPEDSILQPDGSYICHFSLKSID